MAVSTVRLVRLPGLRLAVDDGGSSPPGAPPFLLVHGWLGSHRTWAHLAPRWREQRRVLAVDLRGHGASSAPPSGYALPDLAGDLAALLDAEGLRGAVVVAHSLGCSVTSRLAVQRPDLVAGMVLVDPDYGGDPGARDRLAAVAAIPDDDVLRAAVAELFDRIDADTASPALRAAHRADAARVPAHAVRGTLAGLVGGLPSPRFRPEAEIVLARRTQPVLALHRRPEQASWERGLVTHPDSEVRVCPGAGHWIHEERPARVAAAVDRWLRRAVPSPSPSQEVSS
ncbi:alpha/beta fold hydrolase [Actinomycetospora flava]|uniref:Alpha/beta hydrolase n=1 Tax=Actinomycetospora flava TaxID=3129232 RepID=A0ABU8M9E3_9PSEU